MSSTKSDKERVLTAMLKTVEGCEEVALELILPLMKELVSAIRPSTMGNCPVCRPGTLHYIGDRTVVLERYNETSQAAKVLSSLKEAKEKGSLLGKVERAIGENIPTLERIQIKGAPLYICNSSRCDGLIADLGIVSSTEVKET